MTGRYSDCVLNPVHLRTLVTVLRTGSFADAARTLGFTGSAVSQQMAALERSTRLTLFEREPHRIQPTPAALTLATHAREVLAGLENLDERLAEVVGGVAGLLRVGSFPTASAELLPRWLAARRELYPNLALRLDEGEPDEVIALLVDGELDLGVVYRYDLVPRAFPSGLISVPLLVDELQVMMVASHALARPAATDVPSGSDSRVRAATDGSIDIGDLAEDMWINTDARSDCSACLAAVAAQHGFIPKVDYRSNNYDVIRGLVAAGLGVALVPSLAARAADGVVCRPLMTPLYRSVDLVYRRRVQNAAVPEAIRGLRAAAADLAGELPGVRLPDPEPGRG